MVARKLVLITLGLSLGALSFHYITLRAPCQTVCTIEATGITESLLFNPSEILHIDMLNTGTLYLTQEEGLPTIRVEADQALMPYIDIVVTGKTLKITRKTAEDTVLKTPDPQFFVFVPDIASISTRDTAHIITTNTLKIDSLDLNTRGSAVIQASVDTKQLDVQGQGTSLIILTGTAPEQHIQLSGTCRYEAFTLKSQECSIDASGAANVQILVSERVNGTISGTSKVTFLENPHIFVTQTGTANIKKYAPPIIHKQNAE